MLDKIICPSCGREYLPGEIFIPNYLIGQPKNIERDENGSIVWNNGIEPNAKEYYICDKCKRKFEIKATISYETTKLDEWDMSEDFVSNKYDNRIFLKED